MKIEILPLATLSPAPYNPRSITPEAMKRLERSIAEFDLVEPLVVNSRGLVVIGGHQRLKALLARGATEAECVMVDLDPDREKALNVALNNRALTGEYEPVALAEILAGLKASDIDATLTGWNEKEIDELIARGRPEGADEDAEVPEPPAVALSRHGDLWELGAHRLLCGDATQEEDVRNLMATDRAALLATDPPYGVDFKGAKYNPRAKAWEEIKGDKHRGADLTKWLGDCLKIWVRHVDERACFYLWTAAMSEGAAAAAAAAGIHIQSQIIWVKNALTLGQADYQWKHENCWYGFFKGKKHRWEGGRAQTTTWEVSKIAHSKYLHPMEKPAELFTRPMENHTSPGDICADPFCGSGVQIIAAEKLGRRCYGMEIEPRYVDVAVRRWQNYTGKKARNLTRPEVVIG